MTNLARSLAAALLLSSAAAAPAGAELVFFTTGRTMSVASHRFEGPSIVLALRGGGEIVCDRSLVDHVAPDEVPYVAETAVQEVPLGPLTTLPGRPFDEIVAAASARYDVDPALVHAVIQVESAYQPSARSRKGAMGLMQLMPATARQYGVTNPYDPRANINAGIEHLRSLLDRFELPLALAAYNAGEAAVRRFGGIPPYRETRSYVTRVLQLFRITD